MSEEITPEQPLFEPEAEAETPAVAAVETPRPPRSPIQRAGCIIVVIIWFALLVLLPCAIGTLVTQQEITITTGSAPGQQIRLWLIGEADQRGLAISTGTVHQSSDKAVCVQTNVSFMLWQGSSEPLSYCDCYERANADASWSSTTSNVGACSG